MDAQRRYFTDKLAELHRELKAAAERGDEAAARRIEQRIDGTQSLMN